MWRSENTRMETLFTNSDTFCVLPDRITKGGFKSINSGGENVKCILESKANYKRKCQAIQPCLKLLRVCESSHFIFFLQSNNQHEFSCTLLLGICFMGEILKLPNSSTNFWAVISIYGHLDNVSIAALWFWMLTCRTWLSCSNYKGRV